MFLMLHIHKKYSTVIITNNDYTSRLPLIYHDIPRCLMLYHGQFSLARQPTV